MSRSSSVSKTKPAHPKRNRVSTLPIKSSHTPTLLQRVEDGMALKGVKDRSALIDQLLAAWCDQVGV